MEKTNEPILKDYKLIADFFEVFFDYNFFNLGNLKYFYKDTDEKYFIQIEKEKRCYTFEIALSPEIATTVIKTDYEISNAKTIDTYQFIAIAKDSQNKNMMYLILKNNKQTCMRMVENYTFTSGIETKSKEISLNSLVLKK